MFVTLLATLFFCVRGSNADSGASKWGEESCQNNFCITLNKGETTAEAGLCAVIPCSFSPGPSFTATDLTWMKCKPLKQRCIYSDRIFHTKKSEIVQSGFKGRVSLLEPDVSLGNCSIIINDLTKSDSGSYQFRIIKYTPQKEDGFTFTQKATVSIKDLSQKPTVMVPPLTEGQQTTLTCIAPGLCSGSEPEITWMWRAAGGKHITGTITDLNTESLTSVTQRHSSTLTFNPSAEHHGTKVTCKASFMNNISTEETVTLNVTYVKEIKISGTTSIKESETLKLTCSLDSFPPSLITWSKYFDKNLQTGLENILHNDSGTILHEESGRSTLRVSNVTEENSGRYICRAKHLNNTLMEKVDIKVIYMKKPLITGKTSVVKGHALNLTCSVQSFPPSRITWTKLGSNTNLHGEPDINMSDNSDSAALFIQNMTREDSGRYICTAEHLDTTVSLFADITVTWFPEILQNSECKVQLNVLTCVCITEGFPLPTIKWPLLKNHTEYSVKTTVSDHTVNSTITLTVKDQSSTAVECVSANENGEATESLIIQTDSSDEKGHVQQCSAVLPWAVAAVSLIVNVICIICLIFLWNTRKKVKPHKEDRTYMSLQKRDTSPEYDVIDQPRN